MGALFRMGRLKIGVLLAGAAVVIGAALWVLIDYLSPLPPRKVTMVTGPPGGAYHAYGERYREFFAREGVDLLLVETSGTIDNLNRLNTPSTGVIAGIIQGGIAAEAGSPGLESLGTIFYEPLWFFCRGNCRGMALDAFKGRRIAVGPEGSGTRAVALELLARYGITAQDADLLPLPYEEGSRQLLAGDIDALMIVSSWQSPVVRRLLASGPIDLMSFPHSDACVALYPYLNKLIVPAGLGDILGNRPPMDTTVLATEASLVVRRDVHPAIQYLFLEAAEKIHSGAGIFNGVGQFPKAEASELPLSEEAGRYYRHGSPFLQRYLPFWLAVLIGRLFIILLPVLGLMYPLLRLTPVLFDWKMRRRVYSLYGELRAIELACDAGGDPLALLARLDQLERKADRLWVPISVMGTLYLFKEHLALVRQRLGKPAQKTE